MITCLEYKRFEQEENFVVLNSCNETLSPKALEELRNAFVSAQFNRGEWYILSWRSKIAHVVDKLSDTLVSDEEWRQELVEPTMEALRFVKRRVYDVNPFRDNIPG